ncbi:MAG: glycosyltransferase family 2 protein [Coriobacteriia bacterium]|nr:glycosyltransferase family 2 protein [Coriobacteriia bacterium]
MHGRSDGSPCIYVVTACRNSEATISSTIQSVLRERGLGRYIVVDGASEDSTVSVIQDHATSSGGMLVFISEPDSGIYDAMNKGIRWCLTEARPDDLVAMINADDEYRPGVLARVASMADALPEVDVFYGDIAMLDEDGRDTGETRCSVDTLSRESASDGMPLAHIAMFVRSRVYDRLGVYETDYAIAADYEFVLRLISAEVVTRHISEVTTRSRYGGVSTTNEIGSLKEAIRARIAHGSSPTFEWLRFYKRRLFARAFSTVKWLPGAAALQVRYGASSRRRKRAPGA